MTVVAELDVGRWVGWEVGRRGTILGLGWGGRAGRAETQSRGTHWNRTESSLSRVSVGYTVRVASVKKSGRWFYSVTVVEFGVRCDCACGTGVGRDA